MKETIETLQTLVLLMTLLLQVIMVLGVVYIFRFLLEAFKNIHALAHPVVTVSATAEAPVEKYVPPASAKTHETLPRYKCGVCKARLPENPISSKIDGSAVLLIYRCGRCGKEAEVNPATAVPVSQNK